MTCIHVFSKSRSAHIFFELESSFIMRPSKGFWGFREKGYLFSGIWGEGSIHLQGFGKKHNFLGFREQGAGG